eukprot:CAMPEP_0195571524 /NCGR_PEP_ID=MMETSP0814-20130614/4147_1 /TAXON_ID=97485 /ORGANISM="Prymnesium parvum, Strain Texoma1" /LENGTH=34 /DNA_ID= /DNA_START= /DNA_END= /DNA_ORIENTATION=
MRRMCTFWGAKRARRARATDDGSESSQSVHQGRL